jgi:hypothetical protein
MRVELSLKPCLQCQSNIEAKLDATYVTTRLHRQDLLNFVHRPKV